MAYVAQRFLASALLVLGTFVALYGAQAQVQAWASLVSLGFPEPWTLLVSLVYLPTLLVASAAYWYIKVCTMIYGHKLGTKWFWALACGWLPFVLLPAIVIGIYMMSIALWVRAGK